MIIFVILLITIFIYVAISCFKKNGIPMINIFNEFGPNKLSKWNTDLLQLYIGYFSLTLAFLTVILAILYYFDYLLAFDITMMIMAIGSVILYIYIFNSKKFRKDIK